MRADYRRKLSCQIRRYRFNHDGNFGDSMPERCRLEEKNYRRDYVLDRKLGPVGGVACQKLLARGNCD